MKKQHLPIFFACDDNYVKYLCVTLSSIESHASDEYIYDAHILSEGFSESSLRMLESLSLPHVSVSVTDVREKVDGIRSELSLRLRDYYSESIFYRLFIPELFPELSRAVYLDCDIVLLDDVAKLYFSDLSGAILGAVSDEAIPSVPEFSEYTRLSVGCPAEKYINSGVLVIDTEKFRREKILESFLYLLKKYNCETVAPDQDYLNFLCRGKISYLDAGWNKQPGGHLSLPEEETHLVHYNMFDKPWHYVGTPLEEYFWREAKKTPLYEILLTERAEYSEIKKASDREAAVKLVLQAKRITDEKCGFCHRIGDTERCMTKE